jgi:hypothetical protein
MLRQGLRDPKQVDLHSDGPKRSPPGRDWSWSLMIQYAAALCVRPKLADIALTSQCGICDVSYAELKFYLITRTGPALVYQLSADAFAKYAAKSSIPPHRANFVAPARQMRSSVSSLVRNRCASPTLAMARAIGS